MVFAAYALAFLFCSVSLMWLRKLIAWKKELKQWQSELEAHDRDISAREQAYIVNLKKFVEDISGHRRET
ncbi:hypothetical protein VM_15965 [Vibrio mimicus]|nr:hypothetical protein VM_15965 [Vibrio mimicus]